MSETATKSSTASPWTLTTPRLVVAGVLVAITIVLGISGLGFIPLPLVNATSEHIPVVLGGVLEGPLVGAVTGLAFGIISWSRALTTVPSNPIAAAYTLALRNPLVAILPRVLIGLFSWLIFAGLRRTLVFPWIVRFNLEVSAFLAGLIGSATNTIFVLLLAVGLGYVPLIWAPVVIPQAIAEAIVAAILTTAVARAFFVMRARLTHAPETKPRDQLPY